MVFLGYELVSYKKNDQQVEGFNIFCGDVIKTDLGYGFKTQRWDCYKKSFRPISYFVGRDLWSQVNIDKLKVGCDINLSFNEYGRVQKIQI